MYTSYYVNSKKLEIFYFSNIKFRKEIYVYWNNRKKKLRKLYLKIKINRVILNGTDIKYI